ncbi:MAG: GNAT family N-acetyltransferase [Clostridia bacterium]|nr:GNAT family N-acetyltransferase [Clostridia bacterium]
MEIKIYDALPDCAAKIRIEVFVQEQGFHYEIDETDKIATHFVAFDGETPVATCRVYFNDEFNAYMVGRISVLKAYRGKNIGREILRAAEAFVQERGEKKLILRAQCRALPFYEKCGYSAYGETVYEEGCPHLWVEKSL